MQAETMMSQMNEDQFAAFTTVYDAVLSPQPPHTIFYLDGKAGRGKSFVAAALCHVVRSSSDIAIVAGSSALSVTCIRMSLLMVNYTRRFLVSETLLYSSTHA